MDIFQLFCHFSTLQLTEVTLGFVQSLLTCRLNSCGDGTLGDCD